MSDISEDSQQPHSPPSEVVHPVEGDSDMGSYYDEEEEDYDDEEDQMEYWSQKCSICFDATLDICLNYCNDQYCVECFEKYITEVVMSSSWGIGVTKVKCPVCQESIPQHEWSKYVPSIIVDHYNRFNQPFRSFTRSCPNCENEIKPCDHSLRLDINYQQKIFQLVKKLAETCGFNNECLTTKDNENDAHVHIHNSVHSVLKLLDDDHWKNTPLLDIYKSIINPLVQFEKYHIDHQIPLNLPLTSIPTISTPYPFSYIISHEFTLVSTISDTWKQIQFLHISYFPNMICQDCNTNLCLKCGFNSHENATCEENMKNIITSPNETDDTKKTVRWQLMNSQRCPNCSIMINRDEGCNKVDCLLCGFCFCWGCKSPWSDKCGFYQCSLANQTNEAIITTANNGMAEMGVPDYDISHARNENYFPAILIPARCKGQWQTIPEAARRYKKYTNDSVLEQTALAEASLQLLINNSINGTDSKIYALDSPNNITLRPRLKEAAVNPCIVELDAALKSNSNDFPKQKQYTNIIKARCYYECGKYDTAISILNDLNLTAADIDSGYGTVLYIQSKVIKAVSAEFNNNLDLAIQIYLEIMDIINNIAETTDRSLVDISEEGLYRGSLLVLNRRRTSSIPSKSIFQLLRTYQKITSSQPTHWRIHKRAVVTKYSLNYLTLSYQENEYCPPIPNDISIEISSEAYKIYSTEMLITEMTQLYTIYEKIIYSTVSFPRAGQTNDVILDMVDKIAEDIKLMADSSFDLRIFVDILHRASQRTFNSSKIARHLFHTLVKLGDFKEAENALNSYLTLVGLQSQATSDTKGHGEAIVIDKHGQAKSIPSVKISILKQLVDDVIANIPKKENDKNDQQQLSEYHHPNTIASKITEDKESIESILNTLVTGIHMYCKHYKKGAEATELGILAELVLEASENSDSKMSAVVYRNLGIAYGVMASDTVSPDKRPKYHESAMIYLQKSIKLDDQSWESHYQLAKQYANMRNISDALKTIAVALELNATYLPSWHLLVLLYSCPKQDSLPTALKMCELGLKEAKALQVESKDDVEMYEHYLKLKITHMLLVENVKGSDAALVCQEELFSLYGHLIMTDPELTSSGSSNGKNGNDDIISGSFTSKRDIVLSGSLGNLCDTATAATSGVAINAPSASSSVNISSTNSSNSTLGNQQQSSPKLLVPSSEKIKNIDSPHQIRKALNGYPIHVSDDQIMNNNKQKHHSRLRSLLKRKHGSSWNGSPVSNEVYNEKQMYSTSDTNSGSLFSVASGDPSTMTSTRSLFQVYGNGPRRGNIWTSLQRQRIQELLCLLWLNSAGIFLRQERLDEALKAVEEAEKVVWTNEPKVWSLLGQIKYSQSKYNEAIEAFQKGLVANPFDTECGLWLARINMEMNDLEVSEGILNALTHGKGWDNAEAWYYLGEIYSKTDRLSKTKDCLFYALELENTEPIQSFSILPRCV
ncbi:unnamed protein product [Cunninghamella blakesleeana]